MTDNEMRERLDAGRERCLSCRYGGGNRATCGRGLYVGWSCYSRVSNQLYPLNLFYAFDQGGQMWRRQGWFPDAAKAPPCGAYERGSA